MQSNNTLPRDRLIRQLTYLTTVIAIPFGIAATIVSTAHERAATAVSFVYIPLMMTFVSSSISLRYMKKEGKAPRSLVFTLLDLVSALFYVGVLIPVWIVDTTSFNAAGFGLLLGYTTYPMILNMFIHMFYTLNNVSFKKFISSILSRRSICQQCPNCQAKFVSGIQTTTKTGYSLLQGEDYLDVEADPLQYRDSEDFLREGVEQAEHAELSENSDKGQDMV